MLNLHTYVIEFNQLTKAFEIGAYLDKMAEEIKAAGNTEEKVFLTPAQSTLILKKDFLCNYKIVTEGKMYLAVMISQNGPIFEKFQELYQ